MQIYPPGEENYMPAAFAMSLVMDTDAMDTFSRMTPDQQDDMIFRARATATKEEMDQLIRDMNS